MKWMGMQYNETDNDASLASSAAASVAGSIVSTPAGAVESSTSGSTSTSVAGDPPGQARRSYAIKLKYRLPVHVLDEVIPIKRFIDDTWPEGGVIFVGAPQNTYEPQYQVCTRKLSYIHLTCTSTSTNLNYYSSTRARPYGRH